MTTDVAIAIKQVKQFKSVFRAFENAEEVLELLAASEARLRDLQKELSRLNDQVNERKFSADQEIAAIDQEVKEYKDKADKAIEAHNTLFDEAEEKKDNLRALENTESSLKESISTLQEKLDKLRKEAKEIAGNGSPS